MKKEGFMTEGERFSVSSIYRGLCVYLIIPVITLAFCHQAVIAQNRINSPLSVSKANPRYFADADGNIVYLTGSHTWANLVDISTSDPPASIDFNAYLDWLQQHNHNFIRLWTWDALVWNSSDTHKTYNVYPHPWKRIGPGLAIDGKLMFNLDEFDEDYFNRLVTRADSANKRGIYVSVMLFEGYELQFMTDAWENHPFYPDNNINRISADLNGDGKGLEIYTLSSPEALAIQEKYVKHVIDVLNGFDNVLYEISNENSPSSTQWQYHLINLIHEYEKTKPKQHPVGMTFQSDGDNDTLFASPAEWISTSTSYSMFNNPLASNGDKVIIYDTDHLWGTGGNVPWVWKTFTRGMCPIFMDPYDGGIKPTNPDFEPIRKNMGYTRIYAEKMDLSKAIPFNNFSSTAYCLANPGYEYLVYQPVSNAAFSVTLEKGKYAYEWFDSGSGQVKETGKVEAINGNTQFNAPFSGDAVLYLKTLFPQPTREYTLDETFGQAIDKQGNHNSSDVTATRGEAGKIGNCYLFNGISDKVTFADSDDWSLKTTDDFSISVWINFTSDDLHQWGTIWGNSANFGVGVKKISDGNYGIFWRAGGSPSLSASFTMVPGTWYHVAIAKTSNTSVRFYLDGTLLNTVTPLSDTDVNPAAVYIGGSEGTNVFFNGKIDELGIWKTALTRDDITALYNKGTAPALQFVKGINFGGNAVTIDGNAWLSYDSALSEGLSTNGTSFTKNSPPTWDPVPVDADFATLLNSGLYKSGSGSVDLNISLPVNNGSYTVYLWIVEDYRDYFRYGNLEIEGISVSSNIGFMSKFSWQKYGPCETIVSDGVMNIGLVGYNDDPQIQGLAIFSSVETAIREMHEHDKSIIYPNPSNGHFSIKNDKNITVVEIYSISGRNIYVSNNTNRDRIEKIDISVFPEGVYLIRLFDGEKYFTRKLIIRKD